VLPRALSVVEMRQDALDRRRIFDAGNDLHLLAQMIGGGEYAVIAGEVDARTGDQGRQPGDKVQWLEHDMRGAISIRRLQSVVDGPLGGERETFGAHRRPRAIAAQPFEFGALISGGDHAGVQ